MTAPAFEIRYHEPSGLRWLYVDAGVDPADGAPLTWARPATPDEVVLWDAGRRAELAALLAQKGVPGVRAPGAPARQVAGPRRPLWRRLVRKLLGRS